MSNAGVVRLSFPPVATTFAVVAPGAVNVTIAEQLLRGFGDTVTSRIGAPLDDELLDDGVLDGEPPDDGPPDAALLDDEPPDDELFADEVGPPHATAIAENPTQAMPSAWERTTRIFLSTRP